MNWHMKSRFTLAVTVIFVILGMVFFNVNIIAKKERTQILAEMIQVQQNIAVNLSGDYESGLQLINQLMIEDDEKIQKIKYDLLDDLIKGLDEKEAINTVSAFLRDNNGTLNIYSREDNHLIQSFGVKVFSVTNEELMPYKRDKAPGYYKMMEKPVLEGLALENSRQYYYVSKSQPWVMVTNIRYKNQPDLSMATEKVVSSNRDQVSRLLNFQVLEVNSKRTIVSASSKDLVGKSVLNINPYTKKGDRVSPALFTFNISQPDGTQTPWVGSIKETETSSIIIGTPKSAYDLEYQQLTFTLAFIMFVSFLFAIAIVLLIYRNYLYFLENEQMGGEAT